MGDYGRTRRDQDSRKVPDGGAGVRTPSSTGGGSSADLPPPDAPTLVPGSNSADELINSANPLIEPDAPTLVPPSRVAPSDSPTLVDGISPPPRMSPPPRSPAKTQAFHTPQPVLEEGTVLAGRYETAALGN